MVDDSFRCLYSPLSPNSIRLLRIYPHNDEKAPIRCQLLPHSLEVGQKRHPYDALSYVWGSEENPQHIFVGDQTLPVTENLHKALGCLRCPFFERIVWIDSVCINQNDEREKEQQISFMAKIYSLANRVIVWLGEAADNSDQALESIRIAGGQRATHSTVHHDHKIDQDSIFALFRRPWFQRVWVLQEIAAARNVLITCGSTEIDGFAFCVGADALDISHEDFRNLRSSIESVMYLIRGALFRSNHTALSSSTLGISPLGELIDMYHMHEATKRHDKIYALLGMSSNDQVRKNLLPDYRVPWSTLLQRLVKNILSEDVSVECSPDKATSLIRAKVQVLGEVFAPEKTSEIYQGQEVEIKSNRLVGQRPGLGIDSVFYRIQPSAKLIEDGDILCLFPGAQQPSIIRQRRDYFTIIVMCAHFLTPNSKDIFVRDENHATARNLLLVWDWEKDPEQLPTVEDYEMMVQIQTPNRTERPTPRELVKARRTWNAALVQGDLGHHESAGPMFQAAAQAFKSVFHIPDADSLETQHGLTSLCWAAANGYESVVLHLCRQDDIDPDLEDSQFNRTPLSWAAERGHESTAKILLGIDHVNPDAKDKYGQTPLSWAARKGHTTIVKLLLETQKVDVDMKDLNGGTPLHWAIREGHADVFMLLYQTNQTDIHVKDAAKLSPLHWAARGGNEALTMMLLDTGKLETNGRDENGATPLIWAARQGHEAVVTRLLGAQDVEIDARDSRRRTALWWAASEGHHAVVKRLIETKEVEIDLKDAHGQTPFSSAAKEGHEKIVKLLLETGMVDVNAQGTKGATPLSWAARGGHENVVQLLIEQPGVEIDLQDTHKQTPLMWASQRGHANVVQLLLGTDKVEINTKDKDSRTPLSRAADEGHYDVVKLLVDTGKADINAEDPIGHTAITHAAFAGHEEIVRLLIERSGYDINAETKDGGTLLTIAADGESPSVVKLLLGIEGIDVNAIDDEEATALHIAADLGDEDMVRMLLEKDTIDVNPRDRDDETPLSIAAGEGNVAVTKLLLAAKGIDINARDLNGRTPLSWAAGSGHVEVVKLLLDCKMVDADAIDNDGTTALAWAAFHGHADVVKVLLESRMVKIDMPDLRGETPLLCAAQEGFEEIVRLLLDTGEVDPERKDSMFPNRTPLAVAMKKGHTNIVNMLEEAIRARLAY